MAIRHETESYRLETDRFGFYILTRKNDNASAFFQGDDADLWSRNMDSIESIKTWNANNSLDKSFDCLCSGYDDILAPQIGERLECVDCGLPTTTDDNGWCNACANFHEHD